MFRKIEALKTYLLTRPIAIVLEKLDESEKNDEVALKFMCLVDCEMEKHGLYARISDTNFPKLRMELLSFHTYKSFVYYDYQNIQKFNGMHLQCSRCQFFGPLAVTLTHMSINHNISLSHTICAYCGRDEWKKHFSEYGSLERCYQEYLRKIDVSTVVLGATVVHQIVEDFYCILKKLSESLKVVTRRQINYYTGKGRDEPEIVTVQHGKHVRSSCIVYKKRPVKKSIPIQKLNGMFEVAMFARIESIKVCQKKKSHSI